MHNYFLLKRGNNKYAISSDGADALANNDILDFYSLDLSLGIGLHIDKPKLFLPAHKRYFARKL